MADKKYISQTVNFSAEQKDTIEKLHTVMQEDLGVNLSRAQALTMAASFYLKSKTKRFTEAN